MSSRYTRGVGCHPYAYRVSTSTVVLKQFDRPAAIAAGITVILWASAFVGIRLIGPSFSPGALTLGRLLVGGVVLTILVLVRRPALPGRGDLWFIIGYGVLWFAGYNTALNAAEHLLDAGTTAVLVNIGPVLVAILSAIFLSEGFPRPLVIGSIVAFSGVLIIALGSGSRASVDVIGVILAFVAAVLYASGVLFQKKALARVDPVMATWLGCLIGAAVSLPFAPALIGELAVAPAEATVGLAYLGIFPTAIAFTTWAFALSRMDAGRMSATTYLVPAIAILLAWALLHELPTIWGLIGGAVCLLGVALTRRRPRRPVAPATPAG